MGHGKKTADKADQAQNESNMATFDLGLDRIFSKAKNDNYAITCPAFVFHHNYHCTATNT
jgi:hypothetical protein